MLERKNGDTSTLIDGIVECVEREWQMRGKIEGVTDGKNWVLEGKVGEGHFVQMGSCSKSGYFSHLRIILSFLTTQEEKGKTKGKSVQMEMLSLWNESIIMDHGC